MSVRPVQTNQITEAGNIKSSPGSLIWIMAANAADSSNRYFTLNNATAGSGTEICRIQVKAADTKFFAFPPGFYFSTGIRVGVSEGDLTITGAYE